MNLSKLSIANTSSLKIHGESISLNETEKGRWYLANEDGHIINGCGYSSKTKMMKALDLFKAKLGRIKPAAKKAAAKSAVKTASFSGNINKLKFGKNISATDIRKYNKEIFGDAFKLTNIEFVDGHYWKADIMSTETGKKSAKKLRMDYLLNYLRIPEGLKTDSVVAMVNATVAKAATTGGA